MKIIPWDDKPSESLTFSVSEPFTAGHPFDPETILDMVESLASLALCFASHLSLEQSLAERITAFGEAFEVFDFKPHWAMAGEANIYAGFQVVPKDGYRRLLTALVEHGYADSGVELHGWPILSVVGGTPTVAGAGGASSASGEGDA